MLVVLAADGKVRELHDFFRSTSGTISAVSPTSFVLSGGAVVTPAGSTEITVNGSPAQIAELQVGDYVTVRRNPETSELRQIIVSRNAPPTSAPSAGSVAISSFTISSTRPLHTGEFFDVVLDGTPGGRATFDIGNYLTGISMHEDAPGAYRARFTIPTASTSPASRSTATSPWADVAARAEAPTPTLGSDDAARHRRRRAARRSGRRQLAPELYATFNSPSEVGINTSSIQLS